MTQPTKTGPVAGGATVVLLLAALFVKPWEGRELVAYRDMVGVLTACDGHTGPDVKEGQRFTVEQCDQFLHKDLSIAYGHVRRCIAVPLTDNQAAALTSAAFNIGPRVVCGSTLQRMANAGMPAQAWCPQLDRWNKAGGKVVRGLTRRRAAEKALCLKGGE